MSHYQRKSVPNLKKLITQRQKLAAGAKNEDERKQHLDKAAWYSAQKDAVLGAIPSATDTVPESVQLGPKPFTANVKAPMALGLNLSESTNLILYGPPGTGKTFATAVEAVRLCGKPDSGDRDDLKRRYEVLVEAGQIAFITFHQNYSYEDFVEGLRPTTGTEEGENGVGFQLTPTHGIFRKISALAEQARKTARRTGCFDIGNRQVFKMSLGRAGVEDHIFEAAIVGDYIGLGWGGDIDWSAPDYDGNSVYDAIRDTFHESEPNTKNDSGVLSEIWCFRSLMREGDLIVVSCGNSHFRAIGQIIGPYGYYPNETHECKHRRGVRWLLVLDEPLSVDTLCDKPFTNRSCYLLSDRDLKRAAFARLLPGQAIAEDAGPDQFVLIIDEINRANISKVFGELITLLEPDKRIDATNELKVKLPYSGDTFGIPPNLHIVGTMNTADRSIALLDTALRRRFEFKELMPEPGVLQEVDGVRLSAMLQYINERIENLFDREHQIGHAYFVGCRTKLEIEKVMRRKVIPLLAEYFYEDWYKVAMVLGDAEGQGGFLNRQLLKPLDGLGAVGEARPRYRWTVRDPFADNVYERFR